MNTSSLRLSNALFLHKDNVHYVKSSAMLTTTLPWEVVMVFTPTERTASFKYDSCEIDLSTGEVLAWHFIPTIDTLFRLPEMKGHRAVIINDGGLIHE